jgi:hypothetical protein
MTFRFKAMPPAPFVGGPVCGSDFDAYGITEFPREIKIPHRGRLYSYTLHFRRANGTTLFSYRFKGKISEPVSNG